MPVTKIKSFREFTDRVRENFTEDNEKSILFIDIDGILTTLREFYVENALTGVIKTFMKEQFAKVLSSRGNDTSTLMKLINDSCTPDVVQELTKKIKKQLAQSSSPLQQNEIDEITLNIICEQLAFGLAMETSPACELTLPIIPGNPQEIETLALDLLALMNDKPNLHVFFLTSRPLAAAGNIAYILEQLSKSAGLEDSLLQFIKQRNGGLQLDIQQSDFEFNIHVIHDGICIASGRNNKDIVVDAFFKQLGGNLHQIAFIDDKDKYAAEVAKLEGRINKLVVALQEVQSPRDVSRTITSNPVLNNQVQEAMRDAVATYPLSTSPGPAISTATNLALNGLKMLGLMLTPAEEPIDELAAMVLGRRILADMLTSHIPARSLSSARDSNVVITSQQEPLSTGTLSATLGVFSSSSSSLLPKPAKAGKETKEAKEKKRAEESPSTATLVP
jgi:hypothetical protein